MKEEFVSYSQAVALKECGFDWECSHYYTPENATNGQQWFTSGEEQNYNEHDLTLTTSAPTLALAQKWLRDEKGIDIEILLRDAYRREYRVMVSWVERQMHKRLGITYNEKSYESALSAGLNAALELIKQK